MWNVDWRGQTALGLIFNICSSHLRMKLLQLSTLLLILLLFLCDRVNDFILLINPKEYVNIHIYCVCCCRFPTMAVEREERAMTLREKTRSWPRLIEVGLVYFPALWRPYLSCIDPFLNSIFLWTTLERRRNCALTPLATSQQHNQSPLSPARLRRLRLLLDANLDRHSSEEELERISRGDTRKWMSARPQHCSDQQSSASSDEEVRDLCGYGAPAAPARPPVEPGPCLAASPGPVLFSSSPPRSLKTPPICFKLQMVQSGAQPIILTHFEQSAPYRKYRHSFSGEPGRPSLDLEKMQQVCTLASL